MFLHLSFSYSVHGEGVHASGACVAGAWQGVCLAEGCMAEGSVHGRGGACVAGRACMAGGLCAWWECAWGHAWQGACMPGGMHGRRQALQGACMQERRPLKWVLCLLLECILVSVLNLIIPTHFALHQLRNYDNHFFEVVTQCLFYNVHCKYV